MALTTYRAQVTVDMDSALPQDDIVNTFHFRGVSGGTELGDAEFIYSALAAFYQAIDGQIFPVEMGVLAYCRVYNLADSEPRVPKIEYTFALTPSGTEALPTEVAACLSFQAPQASGLNQARRRGRVFLGPLNRECTTMVGGRTLLEGGRQAAIRDAAGSLMVTALASNVPWAVYSPTQQNEGLSLQAATVLVSNGWVDNAFDTIRSRGTDPSTRAVFPV